MNIQEYVDQMLANRQLSARDKFELLKSWVSKVEDKISVSSILHSSELIKLHGDIKYMNEKIAALEK